MPTMYKEENGQVKSQWVSSYMVGAMVAQGWSTIRPMRGPSPALPEVSAGGTQSLLPGPLPEPTTEWTTTVYYTDKYGNVTTAEVDDSQVSYAIQQGWQAAPMENIPTFVTPEGKEYPLSAYYTRPKTARAPQVRQAPVSISEAVGMLWLNSLISSGRYGPMPPYIINVKRVAPAVSGAPRFEIEWGLRSAPSSLWGGVAETYQVWTNEVVLQPSPTTPGSFEAVEYHVEDALLLPEMAEQIVNDPNYAREVLENDQEIASIYEGMKSGRVSRHVGYWQLCRKVGVAAAQALDDQAQLITEAQLQEEGFAVQPGTLPRFSEETPVNLLMAGPESPFMQTAAAAGMGMVEGEERGPTSLWEEFNVGQRNYNVPIDPALMPVPMDTNSQLARLGPLGPGQAYHYDGNTRLWSIGPIMQEGTLEGTMFQPPSTEQQFLLDIAAILREALGGGGGGRSYVAPDRGEVGDSVKAMLVAMVGRADNARVEMLTDLYMQDHRRAFYGASVEPQQSVKEKIRSWGDYRSIHALRPDFVDEMDWMAYQNQGLMQAGLRNAAVERRAITQAIAGTAPARAGEAGWLYEFQQTGRPVPDFFTRLRNVLSTMSGMVS